MKVYSLTGHSGTGKSYQAPGFMAEHNIDMLIDDGLLIYKDIVEAGVSAKRQKTRVGAIKTALFTDDEHQRKVAEKIKEINPESILIVGTSDRMTDVIARRLGLPKIQERIYIDDITTPEERKTAEKFREQQGKHVIPVPTVQLKRDFAGYFMNPEMLIRSAKDMADKAQEAIKNPSTLLPWNKEAETAKTVVRPTYSYLGDFIIKDKVIKDIAKCVGKEVPGINDVISVYENTEPENLKMIVAVNIDRDVPLWETAEEFQKRLAVAVENMTAFNVVSMDVEVRKLV